MNPKTATILDETVNAALKQFAAIGLNGNELAISLITFGQDTETLTDYRGNEKIYPASVIKLFYMAAAHQWLEDKKLIETDELKRAMKDMIVDSSNDATNYIVDLLTDTTSGPELPGEEFAQWSNKRNVVNQHFSNQGFQNININQKTWGDGPFGREKIFVGSNYENRNMLTTNATALLLSNIVNGKCVTPSRSQQMMSLLLRDYTRKSDDPDNQNTGFSGPGLPPGCKLWSKAGWTSTARHDAIYVETPNGKRFILVIFTLNHAKAYEIIPFIVRQVVDGL